jgi:hypothetical protein
VKARREHGVIRAKLQMDPIGSTDRDDGRAFLR